MNVFGTEIRLSGTRLVTLVTLIRQLKQNTRNIFASIYFPVDCAILRFSGINTYLAYYNVQSITNNDKNPYQCFILVHFKSYVRFGNGKNT